MAVIQSAAGAAVLPSEAAVALAERVRAMGGERDAFVATILADQLTLAASSPVPREPFDSCCSRSVLVAGVLHLDGAHSDLRFLPHLEALRRSVG